MCICICKKYTCKSRYSVSSTVVYWLMFPFQKNVIAFTTFFSNKLGETSTALETDS